MKTRPNKPSIDLKQLPKQRRTTYLNKQATSQFYDTPKSMIKRRTTMNILNIPNFQNNFTLTPKNKSFKNKRRLSVLQKFKQELKNHGGKIDHDIFKYKVITLANGIKYVCRLNKGNYSALIWLYRVTAYLNLKFRAHKQRNRR